ncbi:TPA: phage tail tape measure protein [Yersinia enterocolitica]|nr:phage tail tape measure protein [Yersinia enterocolitica]HDL6635897.1 phage tail tape measure protein [Yersinia enterocolitica]HDL8226089.1 phage tail tape measure protein [Yersinia enterocolitica]HDM8344484.1 phage tail tape measure protein [Yersinia enterocolitica]HDM8382722.1 phage tail tape measure protein [Yersinia enterocolitica]
MKELSFLLSLKNNLSAPLGKAQQSVEQFAKQSQRAFKQIAVGAVGLWGVAQGVKGLLAPAHEVQKTLDELSTRNVSTQALDKMFKAAQTFSTAYGKNAADFISSATIIKSTIAGITDNELPRYTTAINTLAIATKGSAEGAANYMADMANNFRTTASEMGNIPFAEMMASKGAYMVQNFGANLDEIREMVKSSKGTGTQMGAGMDEQLAVLGMLKQTKGTEAGGIYDAFLKSAIEGGKQLGLSFTDAQGQMLEFPDILQKLQAKFGNTIEGNVKAQAVLNKAFGEGAQALTATWGQADKLRKHMRDMGNTQGLDRAVEMAKKMADMWERVDQVWKRIRIAVGMQLIPAISPLADYAINAGTQFGKWLEMFPNIARWIGYIAMATLGMAAAGAIANVVMGVSKFIWMGLTGIWAVATFTVRGLMWAINLKARAIQLATFVTVIYNGALKFLRTALIATRMMLISSTVAMRAYGIATMLAGVGMQLLTSPITLIIAGLVALAAGVWYVISHWDQLKAALLDSAAFQWVMQIAGQVGEMFAGVWASITLGWEMVVAFFSGLSPVEAFNGFVDAIANVFSGLWDYLTESFGATYNWIVSKLNKIPGVNIDLKPIGQSEGGAAAPATTLPAPAGLVSPTMNKGGIAKTLTTNNSNQSSTVRTGNTIGEVNIYPPNGATLDSIMESRELAAG